MSRTIDERVVSMQFDNRHFESNVKTSLSTLERLKQSLNLSGSAKGLESVNAAAKNCNLAPIGNAVESVRMRFSALEVMAVTALANITNSAINAGKRITSALTIQPVFTGFSEYETQINSVQTILANTKSKGSTLDDVTAALDELNTYADKTIYNFTEMTRNIGTFTAAGVDLEKSVSSIKGIANLAAVSGSNAQQASTAMYQLSQALAAGKVQLMDWNSVVNAGMGGEVFQNALKRTATHFGYNVDAMIEKYGSFRESLTKGEWLTAEVLTETLTQLSGAYSEADLISQGYTEKQAKEIVELANTAVSAATDVKTFTQLLDTLKESAQSGWTQTWELVIGDFEEAKKLWTGVSKTIGGFIETMSTNRNDLLAGALTSKWDQMIQKINDAGVQTVEFEEKVREVAKSHNIDIDTILSGYDSFEDACRRGGISTKILKEAVDGLSKSMVDLSKIDRDIGLNDRGDDVKKVQQALRELNYDLGEFGEDGIDGIVGKYTEAAIRAFQEAEGLEITGVIDEETLAALERATSKTIDLKESIGGLIDEIDDLGGRELLIEALANVWNAILTPIKAVKKAWGEVFDGLKPEQLYSFIEGFHAFSENLIMSEENADKVRRAFKGLFSVLEIFTTMVGGGLRLGLKTLNALLGKFDLNILDVAAAAGDALVNFRDWIFSNGILAKSFDYIVTGIADGIKGARDWVKAFIKLPEVQRKINGIKTAFSDALKTVKEFFSGGLTGFKEFLTQLKTMDSFSLNNIGDILNNLKDSIIEYFADFDASELFSKMKTGFEGVRTAIADLLATVAEKIGITKENFEEFGKKVSKFFNTIKEVLGDHMGAIVAIGSLLSMILMLSKIKKTLSNIAKPFEAFAGIGESISGFFNSLQDVNKAKVGKIKTDSILNVAKSIALLAASVWIISKIPKEEVWNCVGVIAALTGLVAAMMVVNGAINKYLGTGSAFDSLQFGYMIKSVGMAFLLMAATIKIIGGMSDDELSKGVLVIGGFTAITLLLMKASDVIGDKNIADFGKMMRKLGTTLLVMAAAIYILGSMSSGKLIQGGLAVTAFLGMMVGMMVATNLIAKDLPKFGRTIIALSTSLLIMTAAVAILGNMDTNTMIKGGIATTVFLGMMVGMMAATKLLAKDLPKFGLTMTGLSVGLLSMSVAVGILGNMGTDTLVKGSLVIAAFLGMMAGMMAATKLLGKNSGSAAKVGVMMLAFSGSILLLTGAIATIALLDPKDVDKAVEAVGKLALIFGALMVVSRLGNVGEGFKSSIIPLAISVGVLSVSLAALSMIDESRLESATKSLVSVIGMFALLVGATHFMKAGTGTLIVMTGAIAILGGVMYLLAELPIKNTLGVAASLSMLIISISAACALMSAIPIMGALAAVANLAIFIGGLILVLAAIGGIAQIPGLDWLINEGGIFLQSVGSAIGKFVGGIIGGIASGATASLPEIGTNLSTFLTNVTPFIEGAKGITAESIEGVKMIADMLLAITGASILDAIASWITGGSSLDQFATQLVPFGEAMASFSATVSGKIDEGAVTAAANAGKIMAEMAETLPNSGGVAGFFAGENDMSTFADQLVPFGEAMASFSGTVAGKIDETAVTAAANAGKMMSEMAATIPNSGGVVGFFAGENDMSTFATQLVPFGNAIVAFSSTVAGKIDETAVTAAANAGKMMSEMATTIPNSGGIVSWFAGDNDMVTFGTQLIAFGSAISDFSTKVSGIDETAITAAANAGKIMSEMAATIPNSGGIVTWFSGDNDMTTFGTQLIAFGSAISSFSDEVTGIDETAVTAASNAGSALAEMSNNLPESGGIWSWFTADNDMSTFASQLKSFGSGIKTFSNEVAGIDQTAITTATTASSDIIDMANNMPSAETLGTLSTFADKAKKFATGIKKMAAELSGIDSATLSTSVQNVEELLGVAKILGDTDFDGLGSFGESLGKLGKTGVDSFIKAFTDSTDKVSKAGNDLIANLIKGVTSKQSEATKTFTKMISTIVTTLKSGYSKFSDAGKYLVQGFADGISANTYKASAKAKAMADAAYEAARKALNVNSPSKLFRSLGTTVPEGFAMGIDKLGGLVKRSAVGMADTAIDGTKRALTRIAQAVNTDIDTQPTIRPVLDLSDIRSNAGAINDMLNTNPHIGALSKVGSINTMMSQSQNGVTNSDVVAAINNLGKKLNNLSSNTYQINGISYDDGSNIADAVRLISRAALVERRR